MSSPNAPTHIEEQCIAHAPGLFRALSDPLIYEFLDESPPPSVEALRETIARRAKGGPPDGSELWLNWSVFHNATIVGYVQATVDKTGQNASIAFVVSSNAWGRGIAAEACRQMLRSMFVRFGPMGLHADAARDNTHSRRLLERLGFRLRTQTQTDAFYVLDPAKFAALSGPI